MTKLKANKLLPHTRFIVEQLPGQGYQITSAEGERSNELRADALSLLDVLGQPDPKGPTEYFRLIKPINSIGEYVGTFVNLLKNGEARYHFAWFRVPKNSQHLRAQRFTYVLLLFVAFVGGMLFCWGFFTTKHISSSPDLLTKNKSDPEKKSDLLAEIALSELQLLKMKDELIVSQNVRSRLKDYLSQKEFIGDTSASVIKEKRAVKLISDLDFNSPRQENMRLSNIDVVKLVELLIALDELSEKLKRF